MYTNEILFLHKQQYELIAEICVEEKHLQYLTLMEELTPKHIDDFVKQITKFFRILALADTYYVFELENVLVHDCIDLFNQIVERYYQLRISKFTKDLDTLIDQRISKMVKNKFLSLPL